MSIADLFDLRVLSTTQIWVVMSQQYGLSVLVSQTSFCGETSGGIVKCELFSHHHHHHRVLSRL